MFLTYDRPEMVNKVVFRRRPSTGTWEVLSPNEAANSTNSTASHRDTASAKQSNSLDHDQSLKTSPCVGGDVLKVHIPLPAHSGSSQLAGTTQESAARSTTPVDPDYKPDVKNSGKRPRGRPRGSGDGHKKLTSMAASCDDRVPSIQSNNLVNSLQSPQNHIGINNISSRTRLKQTHSPSTDSKLDTSPHRYPIRHKQ